MGRFEDKFYESVVVFHPSLTAQQLNDEIERFKGVINSNEGKELTVNNLGRKEIAFAIKKQKMGTYVEFCFHSLSSGLIAELNRLLRISDSVLLFQTHRVQLPKRKYKGNPKFVSAGGFGDDEDGDAIEAAF